MSNICLFRKILNTKVAKMRSTTTKILLFILFIFYIYGNRNLMSDEEQLYVSIGQQLPDSVQSQMFGKPCFKINGKAFVSFFQNEMVFKLSGISHADALGLEGAQLFDPSGKSRTMKEWVQVHFFHQNQWSVLAEEAYKYVSA